MAHTFFRVGSIRTIAALAALALMVPRLSKAQVTRPVPAAPECELNLEDGKLTAHIHNAPLWQVLGELEGLSGVPAHLSAATGNERVSLDVRDVPLSEAVSSMLHGQNFALQYMLRNDGGQLAQIWVFARSRRATPPGLQPAAIGDLPQAEAAPSVAPFDPSDPAGYVAPVPMDTGSGPLSDADLVDPLGGRF